MLTSVANFLFGGAQAENTPSIEEHDLKTSPVEDHEWVIVEHAKGSTPPHEPVPLDDVENMLIEHTSMSVYDNVRQLRPHIPATVTVSKSAKPAKCRARERRQRQCALQKQAPHRAPVVAARAGLVVQADQAIIKTIQRLQSEHTAHSYTRKNLERDNKRNISFKTNGKHRHERVIRPTGRMNVRAC